LAGLSGVRAVHRPQTQPLERMVSRVLPGPGPSCPVKKPCQRRFADALTRLRHRALADEWCILAGQRQIESVEHFTD